MEEDQDKFKIDNQSANHDINQAGRDINISIQQSSEIVQRKYYIFSSCQHVGDCDHCFYETQIKETISFISKNTKIECICGHESIKSAYFEMEKLNKNCIFVVNSHRDINNITYWQLGYAMGKGIEILGLNDGTNRVALPDDVREMIYLSSDIKDFIKKTQKLLCRIEPHLSPSIIEWDNQIEYVKKTGELL